MLRKILGFLAVLAPVLLLLLWFVYDATESRRHSESQEIQEHLQEFYKK